MDESSQSRQDERKSIRKRHEEIIKDPKSQANLSSTDVLIGNFRPVQIYYRTKFLGQPWHNQLQTI